LAAVFTTQPAATWVEQLGPLGAAIGPVNRGPALVEDPHVQARQSLLSVEGVAVPGNPIRLRDLEGPRSGSRTTPPPRPGAHTEELLLGAGYSQPEIDQLRTEGAVAG
jgi:crotonobetainyl-CoA:carnitine CoA-transferase CaiB-like acyl-CoA transferase